ncbi:MAG: formylglycine-generating enzyme family protein [Candidatus Coatesbacteria bacterium]|nr:formylglycine-generating enzyme family protein [Candidatus Coatesbacteria bacterium]
MEFVWIPPGKFRMGASSKEREWAIAAISATLDSSHDCKIERDRILLEGPKVSVRISRGFWMGKQELTLGEFERVTGLKTHTVNKDPTNPIEMVSWDQAMVFCDKLSAKGTGTFRLPTEAEWEYACRAGTKTRFYWGVDDEPSIVGIHCWHKENSFDSKIRTNRHGKRLPQMRSPKRVGLKKPNPWGLYDMCGNVWEYCIGSCEGDYHTATPVLDAPTKGKTGMEVCRVIRGGSYLSGAESCRPASRRTILHPAGSVGFRVVREE